MSTKIIGVLCVACFSVFAGTACTTAPTQAQFERHEHTLKLLTQYAVIKYVEQTPTAQRAARIENIRRIAGELRDTVSGEITLPFLREALQREIRAAKLSAADQLLINGAVDMIAAELRNRIGTGLLDPTQQAQLAAVFQWAIDATALAQL